MLSQFDARFDNKLLFGTVSADTKAAVAGLTRFFGGFVRRPGVRGTVRDGPAYGKPSQKETFPCRVPQRSR